MEVFNRVLCVENIKLEPKYINKNFKQELLTRLKSKVEGVCSKHGYIKHGSIEVFKIAPGVVELVSLAGHIVYEVHFYAEVCNPLLGSIVKARIANINRFGILAEAGYRTGSTYQSVLEIIIAKNSVNIQSEIDLETAKIGDDVKVEILGKKYELGEKKISAIGRIIKDAIKVEKVKSNVDNPELDEDEEEVYEEAGTDELEEEQEQEEEEEEEEPEDNEEEEDDIKQDGGSDFFSDGDSVFSGGDAGEFGSESSDNCSDYDD